MPKFASHNTNIERDLTELAQCPIVQLRQRWRSMFRSEPPAAFGPDLLRRSIAQRMQEQHFGGLTPPAQRQLNLVVKAMASKTAGRIELPKRIKSGAVLVRTWKDQSHRVMVLDHGFAFGGRTYISLSEIAREITGTRWNGPRFFGLRPAERKAADGGDAAPVLSPTESEPPRRRGRPPGPRAPRVIENLMEADHVS